jgi:hypothetical protein
MYFSEHTDLPLLVIVQQSPNCIFYYYSHTNLQKLALMVRLALDSDDLFCVEFCRKSGSGWVLTQTGM